MNIRRLMGWCLAVAFCAITGCGGRDTGQQAAAEPEHVEEETHEVTLTDEQHRSAGIQVEQVRVEARSASGTGLEVPGQVEFDPRRVAFISPRIGGRLERLLAFEGDRVEAGEIVAYLYTANYLTAQTDFLQAGRRAALLAGTSDAAGATSLLEAARRRLLSLGVSAADVDSLQATGQVAPELPLRAPFAGSIMDVHVMPGAAVEANDSVLKLADLSVVDVVADIPERALPLVRLNQRATITLAAYPDMRFDGHVERLRGQLDPATRTVRAAIHAANPAGRLRPGMFATVRLDVALRDAVPEGSGPVLTVPESALVTEAGARFVFVETGPRTYERREVRVRSLEAPGSASPSGDRVAIEEGVTADERVVVRGAFTLKSELAKASLGEHGH